MKGQRGYRRLLGWAALPVTDRKWGATLSAVALGFGLFVGVAIGPGASGTLAGGVPQVIALDGLGGDGGEDEAASGFEPEAEAEGGLEESAPEASGEEFSFPEGEPESLEEAPSEEASAPPAREPEEAAEEEPEEELLTIAGTVVHVNPAAGSYTVAESSGALSAIHAAELPLAGAKLTVPARTLANGTFAEGAAVKKTGTATRAKLEGIVTWVDPDPATPGYVVSKRGVSVLVKVRPDPAGVPPALPVLGAFARVGVEIERLPAAAEAPLAVAPEAAPSAQPLCEGAPLPAAELLPRVPAPVATLWQTSLDASGVPFAYSDVSGVVTAVCAREKTLLISADDVREAGADIAIAVPPKLDTAGLEPGDSILATAEIGAAGELSLKGLASDERSKGAADDAATQGDLVNHLDE